MISANEARALVEASEARISEILQLIEIEIKKKANGGKNVLLIASPDVTSTVLLNFFERPMQTAFTEKQFTIVTKLRDLGFSVTIAKRIGTTVNDEFEHEEFTEYVPQIVW